VRGNAERVVFLAAVAVIAVHVLDDSFIQPEPGTSAGDHLVSGLVPLPSNAAKVNAYDPLLKRARECQQLRHHLPNMVAVNFYLQGDLFRVVDTLNGLRQAEGADF
jgi:hypothetical protein